MDNNKIKEKIKMENIMLEIVNLYLISTDEMRAQVREIIATIDANDEVA